MWLDPETALVVAEAAGRPPYESLTIEALRAGYRLGVERNGFAPVEAQVSSLTLAGRPARLYRPPDVAGPAPAIYFLHGGGWVMGDLDTHDAICRRLANRARAVVVALDYRLAPEHPFPAAVEDALAGHAELLHGAAALGLDAQRIAVAGDSAGGALAAACALNSAGVRAQALIYPVTDLGGESAGYRRMTQGVPLTAAAMRYFRGLYLSAPADALDGRASPLRARDLSGAPPTLVVTAGYDALCEEGQAFAARLRRSKVQVAEIHLADQIHGILTLGGRITAAGVMLDAVGDWLGDRLIQIANDPEA